MRSYILVGFLAVAGLFAACGNETPTAPSESLVPASATTVEVRLPFDSVATDLRVLGGYGSAPSLGYGVVAWKYRDTLDVRTLVRFSGFPTSAQIRDSTGVVQTDSSLTFVGGRVLAVFDTAGAATDPVLEGSPPPLVRAAAIQTPWDFGSTTWDLAVDTVGARQAWPQPGGGPVTLLDSLRWSPTEEDSLYFPVDSATMATWTDSTNWARGLRLSMETPGLRFKIRSVSLQVEARPSVHQDTTVYLNVARSRITFVYSPTPEPPPDGLRIGGVPAWRSIFRLQLPDSLDGPSELCAKLGCPFHLTPETLNYAALILRTRESPPGFQPQDTITLDARPVLRPDLLPKSPVGSSLMSSTGGAPLAPSLFASDAGQTVEIPMTTTVRDLVRGTTSTGGTIHPTIALLSTHEPFSIAYAGFDGPESDQPPVLRLVLTRPEPVELP